MNKKIVHKRFTQCINCGNIFEIPTEHDYYITYCVKCMEELTKKAIKILKKE